MYRFTRKHGWLLTGILVAGVAGCHDDNEKVSYRHEPREPRHTSVNVDVAIGQPEREVIVEESPPVVVEERPAPDVVVVERHRPVVVERRRAVVVVREAPPAVIIERRPRPPVYAHLWIDGYWHHDGHRFVWAKGHYERARRGHHYTAARWTRGDRGWELHAGYWD